MPKYIFVDGVMKLDPAYVAEQAKLGNQPTVANPAQALTIISTPQDMNTAAAVQQAATGQPMQMAVTTTASMEIMRDPGFLSQFNAPAPLDGNAILNSLTAIFAQYEVPVGLVNKLLALSQYRLNFIVDDSGSMGNRTDTRMHEASAHIRQRYDNSGRRAANKEQLTRWEEAQDRMHVMIDMLAYIPTGLITISFMNRPDRIILDHAGKDPGRFAFEAHDMIHRSFTNGPNGNTPILRCLTQSFASANTATMHYLLTDGVPSDGTTQQVSDLVYRRQNPQMNPLTFIACTNDDSDTKWMKKIEEAAPLTSELDDFLSERKEVLKDQGPGFPFSRGFWLICQLVAAINPNDLDALDESYPLTRKTMNDLLGRQLSPQEYFKYFDANPNAKKFRPLYNEFLREDILAKDIIRNTTPGQPMMQGAGQPGMWAQQQPPAQQYYPSAPNAQAMYRK